MKETPLINSYHDEHVQGELGVQSALGFLAGALIGGLAGAATMLLLAPQSGKQTRAKLRHATEELRDQTVAGIEDAVAQTRARAGQITAGVQEKAGELQQRGQEFLDEQKERWSPVVEARKKAATSTRDPSLEVSP